MLSMSDGTHLVRVDKWLWFARFYKTRAQAAEAVRGGKVHVNGVRIKPSRTLQVGDLLEITRGIERYEVAVTGLGGRRGPASEAQQLYRETEHGQQRRVETLAVHAAAKAGQTQLDRKPTKRERRQMDRVRGR